MANKKTIFDFHREVMKKNWAEMNWRIILILIMFLIGIGQMWYIYGKQSALTIIYFIILWYPIAICLNYKWHYKRPILTGLIKSNNF